MSKIGLDVRRLPQKAGFGHYLEEYRFQPPKMHNRSFGMAHEWNTVGWFDGENRVGSRTLADHPQKCVGEGEIQFGGIFLSNKTFQIGIGLYAPFPFVYVVSVAGLFGGCLREGTRTSHATPENRKFCGLSASLAKIGVRLVKQTLQGEIGPYESFIRTYWWAVGMSFDGNSGIVGSYP